MRFELEKREVRRFRTQKLRFWKPKSSENYVLLNLSKEPRIREQEFERGKKLFADFEIETLNERGELERFLWSIPIAKTERVNGELVIYFWENSQRGRQIKEIAERFGYQTHIIKVRVQRDDKNPLNTQYEITHSQNCPCLERRTEKVQTEKGTIEIEYHKLSEEKREEKTENVIEILRKRVKEISKE